MSLPECHGATVVMKSTSLSSIYYNFISDYMFDFFSSFAYKTLIKIASRLWESFEI